MRVSLLTAFICFSLILSACSRGETEKVISLKHHVVDSLDLSRVLRVTQVVPLDNSVPLGSITRVERNQAGIFVWSGNRVYIFSDEGKILGQVGRSGRGPGEYVSISNFSLSDHEVLILDGYTRLLIYDLSGDFLRGIDIPYYASAGKIFGDRIYLDSGYQNGNEKKFHVYSLETLEEENSYQEINDAERTYRHFMRAEHYYVSEDNLLLYHEGLNNRIYQLYPDRAEVVCSFDFWGNTPPDSFFEHKYENVREVYHSLFEGGYVSGVQKFASGRGKFFLRYDKAPETKTSAFEACFAFLDSTDGSSCQSERVYFPGITRALSSEEITVSLTSSKDISFAFPADALLEETRSEGDNPQLVFAEFL